MVREPKTFYRKPDATETSRAQHLEQHNVSFGANNFKCPSVRGVIIFYGMNQPWFSVHWQGESGREAAAEEGGEMEEGDGGVQQGAARSQVAPDSEVSEDSSDPE